MQAMQAKAEPGFHRSETLNTVRPKLFLVCESVESDGFVWSLNPEDRIVL